MRKWSWWGAAALTVSVLTLSGLVGRPLAAQPSMVVLVRHGEKATVGGSDPSLSEAGVARAQALAGALTMLTPNAIVVSSLKRTGETAAVVVSKTGVVPTVIPIDGGGAAHVAAVAAAVRAARGIVLVVGHSNTVPAIVTALGGPSLPDLCDASYATLFVLTPGQAGAAAQVVRAQYGAPDGPLPASCTGMVAK
ncbi:MAG: histidine phosphatase family protein [Gemmatimonadota bacterium]|nr:histidine phosphatase family protein [Gemmatimonadota bacterium]MDQ8167966.1 histidine phosphatase family protein [Gemmatimonadota bacterium]MDQ8172708.1 histidine phosphatase family protein [Gemmatimonadota bacterium]